MRAKERERERVENIKHGIVLPATKGAQLSRTAATGVAAWLAEKRRRSRGVGAGAGAGASHDYNQHH